MQLINLKSNLQLTNYARFPYGIYSIKIQLPSIEFPKNSTILACLI